MPANELFSPTEIGAVAGVSVKSVYKMIEQRLPGGLVVRRGRRPLLTRGGAVCVIIDHDMPKDVPVLVRKQVFARVRRSRPFGAVKLNHGIVQYVVDVKRAAAKMDSEMAKFRKAMRLIIENSEIQGGAATFKGTRILVHHIADLLAKGATVAELLEDYPKLTTAMIAAAPIYAKAHPRRGRPRIPAWRKKKPLSSRTIDRPSA